MKHFKHIILIWVSFVLLFAPLSTSGMKTVSEISVTVPPLQGNRTIINKGTSGAAFAYAKSEGAQVFCGELNQNESFTWQFIYYGKYGNDYFISNQYSMLLLAIEGDSAAPLAKIVTMPLAKNLESDWAIRDEFLFEIETAGEYYKIQSMLSGLYLTLNLENQIIQQADLGLDSQLWMLEPLETPSIDANNLIWAEEFNYNGLPNTSIWSFEQIYVNNEAQQYTVGDPENCYVENGSLRITAKYPPYTSARIITKGKFDFLYGRIEGRIKVAGGRGTWPAFWMMPSSHGTSNPWPDCGEIDIMEYVGFDPKAVHGHVHNKLYNGMIGTDYGAALTISDPVENWHVYGIGWTSTRLIFYVDDYIYFIYENTGDGANQYPYNYAYYIILNLAIGGNWGGALGIDHDIFPTSYYVDWVRVYQDGEDNRSPLEVSGLDVYNVTENQILLRWNKNFAEDLDHYNIYRDGDKIAESVDVEFIDTNLTANVTYNYKVTAVDQQGNEGIASSTLSITTLPEDILVNSTIAGYSLISFISVTTVIITKNRKKRHPHFK